MKTIKGTTFNISNEILVRVTRKASVLPAKDEIVVTEKTPQSFFKRNYIVTSNLGCVSSKNAILLLSEKDAASLSDGDIVKITPNGDCFVLWEESEEDNLIFTTDYCNSACIMCPQIPQGKPFSYFKQNLKMIDMVKNSHNMKTLGISGGEPTFFKDEILTILKKCAKKFPDVPIAMLTNGKNFDDFDFAKDCALANSNTTFCIPLYAAYSDKHDYIVGSKGSFVRSINGIYNLIRLRQKIEIRIVMLKENYIDLPMIIDFIYHNLPFVVHIAIMGMEITGMAKDNLCNVWIDPVDYQTELKEAVIKLKRYNLPFSIYNIQRCLLKRELWGYDADSISEWKKSYLPVCDACKEKENCCGVFSTSVKQSENISQILE